MNNLGTESQTRQVTASLLAILPRKLQNPVYLYCKTNAAAADDGGGIVDDDMTHDEEMSYDAPLKGFHEENVPWRIANGIQGSCKW